MTHTENAGAQAGDVATEQASHGKSSLPLLTVGAIGVVYGDIGTSPIYAFREAMSVRPGVGATEVEVLGLLSLIVWALTLTVAFKYVFFVTRADNNGEGGTLSLMALARKTFEKPPVWITALGVAGAAIGTAASLVIATLIHIVLGLRLAAGDGLLRRLPARTDIARLLRLGLPNAMQQLLFAMGFTALFWIVGQIGTQELAVAHVLVTFSLVAILPGLGFGIAAASLAGQAIGRGNLYEATRWPWDVFRESLPIFALLAAVALLATEPVLALFLREEHLVALGVTPLRIFGLGIIIDALGLILMHALLGAGAARLVLIVAVSLQWVFFLPAAWVLGPYLGFGLTAVWLAMVFWRGAQTAIFIAAWQGGSWQRIRV